MPIQSTPPLTSPSPGPPVSGGSGPVSALGAVPVARPMLLVVAPWLGGGGAERSLVEVLPALRQEFDVHLVTLFSGCHHHEAILAAADRVTALEFSRTPAGVWSAARALRPLLRSSDVVFSLMRAAHLVYAVARPGLGGCHRLVAAAHQLPDADSVGVQGRAEDLLVRRTFAAADAVIVPARLAGDQLVARGWVDRSHVHLVPNAFTPDPRPLVPPLPFSTNPRLRLAFVGRLTRDKGLAGLLEVLAGGSVVPRCDLTVAGDGPDAEALHELAAAAVTRGHTVTFLGHVTDPVPVVDGCDVVVAPSLVELVPYVVTEAWARGRPVLGSDIPAFRALAEVGPLVSADVGSGWAAELNRYATDPGSIREAMVSGVQAADLAQGTPARYVELLRQRT